MHVSWCCSWICQADKADCRAGRGREKLFGSGLIHAELQLGRCDRLKGNSKRLQQAESRLPRDRACG